ncbi:MAG: transposase [Rhodopila sp.]|jgi:transposase|nr:transposase [Rhodopila sp.]
MSQIKRIGIDTSKAIFTLHCVDDTGRVALRTSLRRAQMAIFFRELPPTEIALEACGGSYHWARELNALGHDVRGAVAWIGRWGRWRVGIGGRPPA